MNNRQAADTIRSALQNIKSCDFSQLDINTKNDIDKIILGEHLTFRYILLTALLAKLIDSSIHMRALQTQSSLPGSYDARSLCHSVIVPFDKTELDERLGGSNEPFLNKPARFPDISRDNAVRRGRDTELLETLYNLLEQLNTKRKSIISLYLKYALKKVLERPSKVVTQLTSNSIDLSQIDFLDHTNEFLDNCCGGESAVAVAGGFLKSDFIFSRAKVLVHPSNQAGSSSREVGDIDIYEGRTCAIALEIKDKNFTIEDVTHAINKAQTASVSRLIFMYGRHAIAHPSNEDIKKISIKYSRIGMDFSYINLDDYVRSRAAIDDASHRGNCLRKIAETLDEMRASDATKRNFTSTFANWLD